MSLNQNLSKSINKQYSSLLSVKITSGLMCLVLFLFSCHSNTKKVVVKVGDPNAMIPVEIIRHDGSTLDTAWLNKLCDGYKIKREDIRAWGNRIIILARVSSLESGEFLYWLNYKSDPKDSIVVFKTPFYTFNRSVCSDTISSKRWEHIMLMANLVADPKKQQEYLDYHKTQFEKWPEVSQGFCNAQFQQLLVFKSGRQLVLVISIPKGKTLDELNPLTSKNNPRVDDWNKLMAKYQEGLPGTKKGEVWVFVKPLTDSGIQ